LDRSLRLQIEELRRDSRFTEEEGETNNRCEEERSRRAGRRRASRGDGALVDLKLDECSRFPTEGREQKGMRIQFHWGREGWI